MNKKDKKTFKEFMSEDNVEEIRFKAMTIIRETGMSPSEFAKEVDVSPQVITRFLNEESISFVSLMRIDDYILAYERK